MPHCHILSIQEPQPYAQTLAQQYALVEQRRAGQIPDTLLLLEHTPTVTVGKTAQPGDLLTDREELARRGIAVETVDRGGEITYHGPGQLVGYPILDLRQHGQDLHRYLRDLEEVLIQTVGEFGLEGTRKAGLTGVWIGERKIAAIGIKVRQWVTMHGFALNIHNDLASYRRDFVPCGIRDRGVTSLAEELPDSGITRAETETHVLRAFAQVFDVSPVFSGEMGIISA
ncbi:octanoyltransferase [Capsulimonas corticalis]|uniref:Octanoyltransferase n=1 Tax=Capsulimonas corticalis TaxID=2219043 RepID=A0A402D6T1_9BACT|nr:lipoyl(octanoyl) transferase LipB [Capsulimonas corticalis]BDI31793.1 octanoyltransferase [Capsulimonas corticalis]